MTQARLSDDRTIAGRADLLIIPAFAGPSGAALASTWPFEDERIARLLQRDKAFAGEAGQISALLVSDGLPALLAVGLGQRGKLDADTLRRGAMAAALASSGRGACVFTLDGLGVDPGDTIRAVTEGFLLGRYDYTRAEDTDSFTVLARTPDERAFSIGRIAAMRANWVRRLVETPASALPPRVFAEILVAQAEKLGIAAEIWEGDGLAQRGFGALQAVGGGSRNAPLAVRLEHGRGVRRLGLAGKGMTFDSGGINLKRKLTEIAWMKADMAAAAAVAGAIFAGVELGADPDILAILPIAENMPSGTAVRPGDVVTHPDGRRTEITDTDCEGRLILADAIAFLAKHEVDAIIDVGTLTDGGGVGTALWGCWTNDERLAKIMTEAGMRAGEPGWHLPLKSDYARLLASKVADIANSPLDVPDSGQLAATYLQSFAGTKPWLHIDNGSCAYLEQASPPWPMGATGAPLRALLQFLLDRAKA
ncbi:MAG TPA: M17 family peptidase N-terminal domain-containing protein [Nordella sp.]|nr:M17 family peptidase N-terminal domain-containing protein [Nordella sp.]